MIIANPIYDVVFKRLMEDERIAKFFVSTLINESIEDIKVKPQEFTYTTNIDYNNEEEVNLLEKKLAERMSIQIFRVDYLATIKTEFGEYKKVLIEIQKAKNLVDLMRFRSYLAEQYKKQEEIDGANGKKKIALPIITIYLLGFILPEIETSALKIERNYFDLINKITINKKSDFIEKLTHDCYIVQLPRIESKYQTRLDKLLSVFEQANFIDDNKVIKEYNFNVDEIDIKNITDILHFIGTDPERKKLIENEQEAMRILDVMFGEIKTELLEVKEELTDAKKNLQEKERIIEELKKKLGEQ